MANSNSSLSPKSIRVSLDTIANNCTSINNSEFITILVDALKQEFASIQVQTEELKAIAVKNQAMIRQLQCGMKLDDSKNQKLILCIAAICKLEEQLLEASFSSSDECNKFNENVNSSSKSEFVNNCCCILSDESRKITEKVFEPIVYGCYVPEQKKERLQYIGNLRAELIKEYTLSC